MCNSIVFFPVVSKVYTMETTSGCSLVFFFFFLSQETVSKFLYFSVEQYKSAHSVIVSTGCKTGK